jgi:hypothetical protein
VSSLAHNPSARDSFPTRLGRYEVRGKIGDGGMASVYLGRLAAPAPSNASPPVPRVVALKVKNAVFCRHPEFVTMFLDAARDDLRLV